jgi:hypothetical protein
VRNVFSLWWKGTRGESLVYLTCVSPDIGINSTTYPLTRVYTWLAIDGVVLLALAWYLNNVVPQEWGVARPPWFLFTRNYWSKRPAAVDTDVDVDVRPDGAGAGRESG